MRGIMGFDQASGAMAVGGGLRLGQRLRFMLRDARGARDDLRAHALALKRRELQVACSGARLESRMRYPPCCWCMHARARARAQAARAAGCLFWPCAPHTRMQHL